MSELLNAHKLSDHAKRLFGNIGWMMNQAGTFRVYVHKSVLAHQTHLEAKDLQPALRELLDSALVIVKETRHGYRFQLPEPVI